MICSLVNSPWFMLIYFTIKVIFCSKMKAESSNTTCAVQAEGKIFKHYMCCTSWRQNVQILHVQFKLKAKSSNTTCAVQAEGKIFKHYMCCTSWKQNVQTLHVQFKLKAKCSNTTCAVQAEDRMFKHYMCCTSWNRGEFRPRQTRQLPRAVDLKGRLLSCQSY